jgi:hypothetical protein
MGTDRIPDLPGREFLKSKDAYVPSSPCRNDRRTDVHVEVDAIQSTGCT